MLEGNGPDDLIKITIELSKHILIQSKLYSDTKSAYSALIRAIDSGKAFQKFQQSVNLQGGSISQLELKPYQNIKRY